ncbi:MAG: LamG-like jellyroll fold domain-containing protein [Saprospiraceae bacterium]
MAIRTTLIFSALCLFSLSAFGQNKPAYFKVPLPATADQPAWVQLMYSADPDVHAVDEAYEKYYRSNAWNKDQHVRNYLYWKMQIAEAVGGNGLIREQSPEQQNAAYDQWVKKQQTSTANRGDSTWQPIGPFGTYRPSTGKLYSLQANVFSLAIAPSNSNVLYAGTEGSGVYRTEDKGQHWSPVSYDQPFCRSVHMVSVHPTDPNHVLAGVNNRIYLTTNGGNTWTETLNVGGRSVEFKFHPTISDRVFAVTDKGLRRSEDGGQTWTNVTNNDSYDLEFKPGNPQVIYVLQAEANLNRSVIYRSDDGGTTWNLKTTGYYPGSTASEARYNGGKIAVTPANPDLIYVSVLGSGKLGDNGWIGLYHSTNSGESWSNPAPQDGSPYESPNEGHWSVASYGSGYHQGFYNHDLEISPTNPNKLWMGTVRLAETTDQGATWKSIGGANSQRLSTQHADIQDIEVLPNGEVWIASDGGIDVSSDELTSDHEARIYGLDAADFWGFAAGWNEDLLVGGKYHNGNSAYYHTYAVGDFNHVSGVEEATGYTNPYYPDRAIFGHWNGQKTEQFAMNDVVTQSAQKLGDIVMQPRQKVAKGQSSLLTHDVRYGDWIYLGRDNKFWASDDGGASFEARFAFPDSAIVRQFAQSRDQPEVFYACAKTDGQVAKLWRSASFGESWTEVEMPGNNKGEQLFTLDPNNADRLWLMDVYSRADNRFFESTDGGQTWTNRTPAGVSTDRQLGVLAVPTPEGTAVYYTTSRFMKVYESWNETWRDYDSGMPYIKNAIGLAPFYPEGKLRMGSTGRGIWEVELAHQVAPQAFPMASNKRVTCAFDTIRLESHSILDQRDGATFAWTISPTPDWISDVSERSPQLVLSQDGSYDVTLTVTDADGRSSTRTIEDMLELENQCSIGSEAGLAFALNDGEARLPTSEMEASNMTIMLWMRPTALQSFAGVLMCRNSNVPATGIHMTTDNELRIHYDGSYWGTRTDLFLNPDEWYHIAATFAADGAVLYVNGVPTRISNSLPPLTLTGEWALGADPGYGDDRRLEGDIDELSIWDRPLSLEEIRSYRHRTLDPTRDQGLKHYYQFDSPISRVIDVVGRKDGQISKGIKHIPSTVPVGAGTNEILNSISGGDFISLTDEQLALTIDGSDTYGPISVTHVQQPPHDYPMAAHQPDGYWIINDYSATPADGLSLLNLSSEDLAFPVPTTELLRRSPNDTSEVQWTALCDGNLDGDRYAYTCVENGISGQYFYGSSETFAMQLDNFEGDTVGRDAHLDWTLTAYQQNDTWTLEHRDVGASTFVPLDSASAFGNNDFSYIDTALAYDLHTYRLRLTTADGEVAYSPEVDLTVVEPFVVSTSATHLSAKLVVAPNPVAKGKNIRFSNLPQLDAQVVLYDTRGREQARTASNDGQLILGTNGLAAGVYVYQILVGDVMLNGRVIVE